jgi:UDP-N-acetylmuramoyl-L-alanyl-D-glutamate--2,6-diaminopimelate ligase
LKLRGKRRLLRLSDLIKVLPEARVTGKTGLEISHLAYDSRKIKSNGLFVAITGHQLDGHRFIDQAIQNGAKAVVVENGRWSDRSPVTMIRVKNSRQALSRLAACFFGFPASRLHLIGITGTSGKTTVSYLIESILKTAGFSVGVLGTIDYRYGSEVRPASVTTPESLDLQRLLADMVREKITHVVMEVSSHALDQGRVGEMQFDQAVFTNLSQDHLDYHHDLEAYFQTKARLFRHHLKTGRRGVAVINQDDPFGKRLGQEWKGPQKGFGIENKAAYAPLKIQSGLDGIRVRIKTPEGEFGIRSFLIGRHNIYNLLAAWAVGEGFKLAGEVIQRGIESLKCIPGRMEPVPNNRGLTVLVDYSHKPEALRLALGSFSDYKVNKIVTVFGCGGDRDPHKRPLMGRIAGEHSHLTIVTSDNPRSEDPQKIIAAIEQGLKELGLPHLAKKTLKQIPRKPGYTIVPDRREAISLAIGLAQSGDIVLIAGKGHENYQLIGTEKLEFDDREEARKALGIIHVQYQ